MSTTKQRETVPRGDHITYDVPPLDIDTMEDRWPALRLIPLFPGHISLQLQIDYEKWFWMLFAIACWVPLFLAILHWIGVA
jgi:hypothetical protein